MYRRALLTAATATLAGCGLAPDRPASLEHPTSAPNLFASFEWLPDESAYRVTIDRGNRITRENTGELFVESDGTRTVWVADEGSGGDGAAEFPVEPGDSLVHSVDRPADVILAWRAPDGHKSAALDRWALSDQPAAGSGRETGPSGGEDG